MTDRLTERLYVGRGANAGTVVFSKDQVSATVRDTRVDPQTTTLSMSGIGPWTVVESEVQEDAIEFRRKGLLNEGTYTYTLAGIGEYE